MFVGFAVDGFKKCEKWRQLDMVESKETKTGSQLNRFIGWAKKPEMTGPFPFSKGRFFLRGKRVPFINMIKSYNPV